MKIQNLWMTLFSKFLLFLLKPFFANFRALMLRSMCPQTTYWVQFTRRRRTWGAANTAPSRLYIYFALYSVYSIYIVLYTKWQIRFYPKISFSGFGTDAIEFEQAKLFLILFAISTIFLKWSKAKMLLLLK